MRSHRRSITTEFNIIRLNTHNPEALARHWRLGLSEFSVDYDIAFQRHLDQLTEEYKDFKLIYVTYQKHVYKHIKNIEGKISKVLQSFSPKGEALLQKRHI